MVKYCVVASKNNRRKRKKRCYNKKQRPKSSGSQSSDTSTTSEVADLTAVLPAAPNQEGIFVMDDIESSEKVSLDVILSINLCADENNSYNLYHILVCM